MLKEKRLEKMLRWTVRPSFKQKLFYATTVVLTVGAAAYFGLKNLVLRKELVDIRAHKGYVAKPEYDSLQERVDGLSAELHARKSEIERLREELKQYGDN